MRAGRRVDLEHAIEAVHGDGHDGVGLRRVDAPHHRRAGAERHDLGVAVEHQSSTASSSASVRGWATASVGLGKRRLKASVRSVRWAPWEWNARSHVSVVHTSASESGTATRGGRSSASAKLGTGRGVIETPNRFDRCSARLGPVGVGRLLRLQPPRPERPAGCHERGH